jgi:putative DNA primase/helicase
MNALDVLEDRRGFTDAGNADRLVDLHGDDLIYVPGIGWFVWTGDHWERDGGGEVMRRARLTVADLHRQWAEAGEGDYRARLLKHAVRSESLRSLAAMISLAQSDARVEVMPDQLDANPWALNTPAGIVELRTGHLRAHDRRELHTLMTRAAYSPGLSAPVWEAFLNRVTNGDQELQAFLQRLAGLALIGEVIEHLMPILHGLGANGKSTFVETIMHVLGDYAGAAPLDLLMAGRRNTGAATPEIAGLRGRRLVIVSKPARTAGLQSSA